MNATFKTLPDISAFSVLPSHIFSGTDDWFTLSKSLQGSNRECCPHLKEVSWLQGLFFDYTPSFEVSFLLVSERLTLVTEYRLHCCSYNCTFLRKADVRITMQFSP